MEARTGFSKIYDFLSVIRESSDRIQGIYDFLSVVRRSSDRVTRISRMLSEVGASSFDSVKQTQNTSFAHSMSALTTNWTQALGQSSVYIRLFVRYNETLLQ